MLLHATVPQSRLKTKGDYAFSVRAPMLWNDLPDEIRLAKPVIFRVCSFDLFSNYFTTKCIKVVIIVDAAVFLYKLSVNC